MKKVRPEAKIKTLAEDVQATLWELLNVPMEGKDKPLTYVEARAWLLKSHRIETSNAALSDWYSWYGLRLRTERRKAIVDQAIEELAQSDPSKTLEDLHAFGQVLFTAESIEEKDAKAFTEVWRASEKALTRKQAKEQSELDRAIREKALELESQKIAAATKTKLELGLDALAEVIKGNKEAQRLYRELRKTVSEA